jgi:hypothetical protein
MKYLRFFLTAATIMLFSTSCSRQEQPADTNIIFLHHSTGSFLWYGKRASVISRAAGVVSQDLRETLRGKGKLFKYFEEYNQNNGTSYYIEERDFPKSEPYGWKNFPYDYYNIWVNNEGNEPYLEEPTLEILTGQYQVIIFKHCFPVSRIEPDLDLADINSEYKSLSNYKLQYTALRNKLLEFPETRFILFTGAVHVENKLDPEQAARTKEFFDWVRDQWDQPGDNIYLWDLYEIQTEGGLYFKNEYAISDNNSHPNNKFSSYAGKLLFNRIVDVIGNDGEGTLLTGEKK